MVIFYLGISLLYGNVYGEEKKFLKNQSCIKNFNIDDIDFTSYLKKTNNHILVKYFACRAAVVNSIQECNNLSSFPAPKKDCYAEFNSLRRFYLELLDASYPTAELIEACPTPSGIQSREDRKRFIKALIGKNLEFCNNFTHNSERNFCKAIITLDPNLVKDHNLKEKIYLLRAVKDSNEKECSYIRNKNAKIICRALVNRDVDICQEYEGFKIIRNMYCK